MRVYVGKCEPLRENPFCESPFEMKRATHAIPRGCRPCRSLLRDRTHPAQLCIMSTCRCVLLGRRHCHHSTDGPTASRILRLSSFCARSKANFAKGDLSVRSSRALPSGSLSSLVRSPTDRTVGGPTTGTGEAILITSTSTTRRSGGAQRIARLLLG